MPGSARSAFRRRFRSLTPAGRRSFLADLWDRRGLEVQRRDDTILVGSGPKQRAKVAGFPSIRSADVDILVTARAGRLWRILQSRGDIDVLDAGAIYDQVRYGLDRGEADALCRSHFGRSLTEFESTKPTRAIDASAIGMFVLFVVFLGVGALLIGAGPGTIGSVGSDIGTASDSPAAASNTSTESAEGHVSVGSFGPTYPDGLSPNGVTDADTLVAEHRDRLGDRPHRIRLFYSGPANDSLFPRDRMVNRTIDIGHETRLARSTHLREQPNGLSLQSVTIGEYRTPTERYNWISRNNSMDVLAGESFLEPSMNPYQPMPAAEWYRGVLTAPETEVETVHRNGALYHRLTARGTPERRLTAAEYFRATVVLTAGGQAVEISIQFSDPETEESVAVTLEFEERQWGSEVARPAHLDDRSGESDSV